MVKGFMTAILTVATLVGAVTLLNTPTASADHRPDHESKIKICHRTSANPNADNPYNDIEVPIVAIDGEAGNENGNQPDHFGEHTGGIYDPVLAEDPHYNWGDIIPPVAGHSGLNWTTLGQAIYNNDCNPVALMSYDVDCTIDNQVRVTLNNDGNAAGEITVNGTVYELGAGDQETPTFPSGTMITIVLKGETVYNQVFTCTEGEVTEANITISYICDVAKETFVLTLTNSGDAEGSATVNGSEVTVAAGESKNISLAAGGNGTHVTVVVDEKTVLDQTFVCVLGRGNVQETPTIPTGGGAAVGDVTSLPVTSGAGDKVAALVVMIGSILATAGGYALRARSGELSI